MKQKLKCYFLLTLYNRDTYYLCTHGLIKLFIAAMAYYINTLDSQSSGRGRYEPNYFKVGDLFEKNMYLTHSGQNQKN